MEFLENNTLLKLKRLIQLYRSRVIVWFSLLILVSIIVFFTLGYYSASTIISYLPKVTVISNTLTGSNQIEIKSPWYELFVDKVGRIDVKTLKGDVIMSGLTYYTQYEGKNDIWGLKNVSIHQSNDSTIIISGNCSADVLTNLTLQVHTNIPKLDVQVNTQYFNKTIIQREALVASFDVPVTEVYLKNRKIDKENFEPEYWLQSEGARFGQMERSAFVYHTPSVSSLQLEIAKRLLFINLEYFQDHPHIKIPYQKDEGGKWVDLSKAVYLKGSERNNNFSINFGDYHKAYPRLMLVPNGYKAGYVFTEHADGGTIRKQRAAYFGSEDISNASKATGGFVGHKIPVTKSVFYTWPEDSTGEAIFQKQKDTLLINFLDQLNVTGLYDICLHTPENLNSNRKVLAESIKFMKERYNTVSWIDHGFFGGKINREAMTADGLDSTSVYYAADLWKKYDTKYFWSTAVEQIRNHSSRWISAQEKMKKLKFFDAYVSFLRHYLSSKELKELSFHQAINELYKRYSFRFELNSLKSDMDNSYPTPLYWQYPTLTKQFYFWATDYVKGYVDLSNGFLSKEEEQLNKLVNDQGIFINHGYYVRNSYSDGTIEEENGKFIINPNFDELLSYMGKMRDTGDLYITTIKDLLDYWIMLKNVSFDYMPNGQVYVSNNNSKPIQGLSIIINAKNVQINGKNPSMKKRGDETIFWFDIPAKTKIIMSIK